LKGRGRRQVESEAVDSLNWRWGREVQNYEGKDVLDMRAFIV